MKVKSDDFAAFHKAKELEYYNAAVERIDTKVIPLCLKQFDHSLNTKSLQLLQRQLQQAISAYELAVKRDQFVFAVCPFLGDQLTEKRTQAIRDLKNALTVVETKLQHNQTAKKQTGNNEPTKFEDVLKNPKDVQFILTAMYELNITDANGNCTLPERKRRYLLAFIRALRERPKPIVKNLSDKQLTVAFCAKINTHYSKLEDIAHDFKRKQSQYLSYINDNYTSY